MPPLFLPLFTGLKSGTSVLLDYKSYSSQTLYFLLKNALKLFSTNNVVHCNSTNLVGLLNLLALLVTECVDKHLSTSSVVLLLQTWSISRIKSTYRILDNNVQVAYLLDKWDDRRALDQVQLALLLVKHANQYSKTIQGNESTNTDRSQTPSWWCPCTPWPLSWSEHWFARVLVCFYEKMNNQK